MSQPTCTPIIFDCDPGLDDAVALLMAMASPEIDILGVTTVVGNTNLAQIQRNARQICELGNRPHVRVFAGCPRPMLSWTHYDTTKTDHLFDYVSGIHGPEGLGGLSLPTPQHPLEPMHAVSFIIETLRGREEPLTLLATGPLTNIALALIMAPDIRTKISRIILMGGAQSSGNITPAAEHNFFVDPHAASVVFESGIPLVMSGLDLTRQVLVTPAFLKTLRSNHCTISKIVASMIDSRPKAHFEPGMTTNVFHDPTVVGYLLKPSLFTGRAARVSIEIADGPEAGRSRIDFEDQNPNTFVLETIHIPLFYDLVISLLESL